ncbi:hypothetical protein [Cardinium endosymbiont of Sogatella furcifera]|uniref:hypothetical protein n=1 Tax=Cardinium endosymbiont of Sogatella furcifera TaxID=650378 RepID=UPI0013B47164|nr:hypothetical protein [Cardinium endosymbiont of Sogatella furcifera]
MNLANLSQYILRFFLVTTWLFPCVAKAVEQANLGTTTLPTKIHMTWQPYPRAIQLRSGVTFHKHMHGDATDAATSLSDEQVLVVIPTTIDFDILYIHSFFAKQLESYPSIGLSFLLPYALGKAQQLRFPNIWGILAYIELYQSDATLSTWGNRVNIGAMKGSIWAQRPYQPSYSFLAIKEITYHWLLTPSWQLNFSIGLLLNWWTKNKQHRPKANPITTPEHANAQPANPVDNAHHTVAVKFAPLASIGIRYTTQRTPFLEEANKLIRYSKQTNSRVDCSLAGSSRQLPETQKYHLILRGSALLSFTINAHNALLCAMELGYNWYKQALVANMLPAAGMEITPLLGYEIRYGRCLMQLQLGCELTDSKKPTIQTTYEQGISNLLKQRGKFVATLQYMLTERFFVGVSARSQEIPALRLGISWPSNN